MPDGMTQPLQMPQLPEDAPADITPDTWVDAIGLLCPLPVLRLRKRLMALPAGGVLCLLADDPVAVIDVPHFCAEAGHELVWQGEAAAHQVYVVRRGGVAG